MNDDDQKLNRELLERATSRGAIGPSDEDARPLQERFLSLGRALEASQREWSEAELLSRLDMTSPCTEQAGKNVNPSQLYWLAAGVLAASALFATARILLTDPGPAAEVASSEPSSGAETQDALSAGHPPENASASTQQQQDAAASATWTDPLDRELTAAARAIGGYSAFDARVDRSLANVQGQLESLANDLATESL